MDNTVANVVSFEAVVFPPCVECGAAYKPSRPIEDYGTVYFRSKDRIANTLYIVESFIKRLRLRRLRSL